MVTQTAFGRPRHVSSRELQPEDCADDQVGPLLRQLDRELPRERQRRQRMNLSDVFAAFAGVGT